MVRDNLYIVDVFAEEKYAGNQLAVIRPGEMMSDVKMQRLANEMHYSETTFILSDQEENGGYPVRIFTPAAEIPFAGHPTLGTAFIIQREIIRRPVDKVVLNLKVGPIPVTFNYRDNTPYEMWMKQIEPTFISTLDRDKISRVLNLDIGDVDERFPVQEVSTGTPFVIAPLKTLAAVQKAVLNRQRYFETIEHIDSKAILFFAPETVDKENQLHVRMFADFYGVPEDPATGSANGCLAGYLVKHRYFGKDSIDIRVEQGYQINRPSRLYLKAEETNGIINIRVGGKVVMVARGELT
ncbi:MAG: PhzF family phenazine biosynthesis protein [candidate division Zixibacteria bacterium]|nr:PhzF family phenazine biosynthesis protein [candidate division Zixibacteria bacterium]